MNVPGCASGPGPFAVRFADGLPFPQKVMGRSFQLIQEPYLLVGGRRCIQGQDDGEGASFAHLTLDLNAPAVAFYDAVTDG